MAARTSPGKSRLRVLDVRLRGFRGVRGELDLSFVAKNKKPVSAIIFGENGTGKSSIVDAVEWACQGKVGRSARFDARSRPLIFNAAGGGGECSVAVNLNDNSTMRRSARRLEEGGIGVSSSGSSDEFAFVPMSLKRADILMFLEASPEGRGALFMDHFLATESERRSASSEREHDASDVIAAAKTRVRQAAANLANLVGIDAPHELGAIRTMLNNDVYKGVAPKHRDQVRLRKGLDGPALELVRALDTYEDTRRRIRNGRSVTTAATERVHRTLTILGDVSDWMTDSFRRITGAEHVTRISAQVGRLGPMSLELDVHLSTGFTGTPQRIFSEGYQDLVALLYYLAVARAAGEQGQAKVLILDDVLQSVDAAIRVRLMQLVLDEFPDWQLLVTVHDRLWRTQLLSLFQSAGHPLVDVEIREWGFEHGPTVSLASGERFATSDLEYALTVGVPATVCAVAGRLLEQIADRLSWTLPISVQRRRGDRYTLNDLWPGVRKALGKTSLDEACREVETWTHLRNAVGAHYNEWAENVTWSDAENFGLAVLALAEAVHCSACGQWVEPSGRTYRCRCGAAAF